MLFVGCLGLLCYGNIKIKEKKTLKEFNTKIKDCICAPWLQQG
jgi:hypothetical protein